MTGMLPKDAPIGELRVFELRGRIALKAGTNERGQSPLTMSTLNSSYAYITGEFFTEPRNIATQRSPGVQRTRLALAFAVLNHDYGIDSFIPAPDDAPADAPERPFRKSELQAILRCMTDVDDQREWTP